MEALLVFESMSHLRSTAKDMLVETTGLWPPQLCYMCFLLRFSVEERPSLRLPVSAILFVGSVKSALVFSALPHFREIQPLEQEHARFLPLMLKLMSVNDALVQSPTWRQADIGFESMNSALEIRGAEWYPEAEWRTRYFLPCAIRHYLVAAM